MKPKKVICPICGKEMIAKEWGKRRRIMQDILDRPIPLCAVNYIIYECSCGCTINYQGEKSCWECGECKCKKQ